MSWIAGPTPKLVSGKDWLARMTLLILVLIVAGSLFIIPTHSEIGMSVPDQGDVTTKPTPTPQTNPADFSGRPLPIVGILVLLALLVFIAWRSRGAKQPKMVASCCAPVIDENKRPFKIYED